MVNAEKKSFEAASNDMKRLMNFSFFTEEDKKNYTSEIVEFKKIAADGKCYGIVREGNNKHYIKVSNKTDNPSKEDFNYIGGITEKARYCYETYQGALKNIEFKLREIKESKDKSDSIIELMNASRKQEIINENVVEMSKEIARQREIMFKTSGLIKEDLGYKPVLKITSSDADKKAEPFTEKVPEPKGDETPSKGNTTPESADKPYNTEVNPDMKADPSKAGKKFKITGLQLKAVKSKLKEGINDEIGTTPVSELEKLKLSSFADPRRQIGGNLISMINSVPSGLSPVDEYEYADKILEIIGKYRTAGKMTSDIEKLYDKIYEILEGNEYYQEITSLPDDETIEDLDGDVDINDEWETPNVDDENFDGIDIDTKLFDEGIENDDWRTASARRVSDYNNANPIDHVNKNFNPHRPGMGKPGQDSEINEDVDWRTASARRVSDYNNANPINHVNKNFNPHRPGMGKPGQVVEDEPTYEFDEDQLTEAILDVFGKVETFGKEPFSMPGGGTRQYATQKPKAWGTEVVAPESEVTEEPENANQELKPKQDVVDKSVYIKGLAESIAKEIKKKV